MVLLVLLPLILGSICSFLIHFCKNIFSGWTNNCKFWLLVESSRRSVLVCVNLDQKVIVKLAMDKTFWLTVNTSSFPGKWFNSVNIHLSIVGRVQGYFISFVSNFLVLDFSQLSKTFYIHVFTIDKLNNPQKLCGF